MSDRHLGCPHPGYLKAPAQTERSRQPVQGTLSYGGTGTSHSWRLPLLYSGVRLGAAACGCMRLCAAVCGCVRPCAAMCGCVRLCSAVCSSSPPPNGIRISNKSTKQIGGPISDQNGMPLVTVPQDLSWMPPMAFLLVVAHLKSLGKALYLRIFEKNVVSGYRTVEQTYVRNGATLVGKVSMLTANSGSWVQFPTPVIFMTCHKSVKLIEKVFFLHSKTRPSTPAGGQSHTQHMDGQ